MSKYYSTRALFLSEHERYPTDKEAAELLGVKEKFFQLYLVPAFYNDIEGYTAVHEFDSFPEISHLFPRQAEDNYYDQPTLSYCHQYAVNHDMDPANVFIDWGRDVGSFEVTFANIEGYLGGVLALPYSALLRGSNMEYVYSDSNSPASFDATLNSLLNE